MTPSFRFLKPLIALGLPAALACTLYCHTLGNKDIWLHLKAGAWILEHRAVPRVDPFSFSAAGEPWIDHAWLYQLCAYAFYRFGGFPLLTVAHGVAAALALLFACRSCSTYVSYGVIGLAALLPAWGQFAYPLVRPQVFTLLLTCIFMYLLRNRRTLRPVTMGTLALLQVLWVNSHGGYVLGLVVIGCYTLEQWWDAYRDKVPAARNSAIRSTLLLAVASAGTLLNPYGFRLIRKVFRTLASQYGRDYVTEWFSLSQLIFHRDLQVFLLFLALVYLTCLLRRGPMRPFHVLVTVSFAILAFRSVRFLPVLGLVAIPLLAENAQAIARTWPPQAGQRLRTPAWTVLVVAPLTGIWLAAGGKLYALTGKTTQAGFGPNPISLPVDAATFIAEREVPGPLFHPYGEGGYLIWSLFPTHRVLQDGRNPLYGDARLYRFRQAIEDAEAFVEVDATYAFQSILLTHWQPENQALIRRLYRDPAWLPVYADQQAVLFVRAGDANRERFEPVRPAVDRPPVSFTFTPPGRLVRRNRLISLFREPVPERHFTQLGYVTLYRVVDNLPMQAWWLMQALRDAPAYVYKRDRLLAEYRDKYQQLPEWMK